MAIFGIGAYYGEDVSQKFVDSNLIGIGWTIDEAPELHQFINSLKVGDIVYIKSFSARSTRIYVKAIGIITDSVIRDFLNSNHLVRIGRNVRWFHTEEFSISKTAEKNNVRSNSLYEEFNPEIQNEILNRVLVERFDS